MPSSNDRQRPPNSQSLSRTHSWLHALSDPLDVVDGISTHESFELPQSEWLKQVSYVSAPGTNVVTLQPDPRSVASVANAIVSEVRFMSILRVPRFARPTERRTSGFTVSCRVL